MLKLCTLVGSKYPHQSECLISALLPILKFVNDHGAVRHFQSGTCLWTRHGLGTSTRKPEMSSRTKCFNLWTSRQTHRTIFSLVRVDFHLRLADAIYTCVLQSRFPASSSLFCAWKQTWILGGSLGLVVMFQRLGVQIPAPYTGWTFSHLFVVKIEKCVWKDENKWKRGRGWPVLKKETLTLIRT